MEAACGTKPQSVTLSAQSVRAGSSLGLPGTESDLSRCAQTVGSRENPEGSGCELRAIGAVNVAAAANTSYELPLVIAIRANGHRLRFRNRIPTAHARLRDTIGLTCTTTALRWLPWCRTLAVGHDCHRQRRAREAGGDLHGRQSQYRERLEPLLHGSTIITASK